VSLEEGHNFLTDGRIITYVRFTIGEPALEKIRFVTLGQEDADDDFGGQFVVRPVEGHSGNGVASKSRAGLFIQPRSGRPSLVSESLPLLHQCNIRRVPALWRKTAMPPQKRQAGIPVALRNRNGGFDEGWPGSECNSGEIRRKVLV